MLRKIVSGAQTGADLGGLKAAKYLGLETGGWMPLGMFNQNGKYPEFKQLYGIQETNTPQYAPRTYANVRDSDGTVRFAYNYSSPGELCTLKAINQYGKPYVDIHVDDLNPDSLYLLVDFVQKHGIETLNVAGNSERTCRGIENLVTMYLILSIQKLVSSS